MLSDVTGFNLGCEGAKKQSYAFTVHTAALPLELECESEAVRDAWIGALRMITSK